jgi:hypothetical protein
MNTITTTASTSAILTIDLGKYKSVACVQSKEQSSRSAGKLAREFTGRRPTTSMPVGFCPRPCSSCDEHVLNSLSAYGVVLQNPQGGHVLMWCAGMTKLTRGVSNNP